MSAAEYIVSRLQLSLSTMPVFTLSTGQGHNVRHVAHRVVARRLRCYHSRNLVPPQCQALTYVDTAAYCLESIQTHSVPHISLGREPVLSPEEWREFPLSEKIPISHNTALYRFSLPDPEDTLGLPPGQHISVSAEIEGKNITRSYTPTTGNDDLGHFDLVVKVRLCDALRHRERMLTLSS